ARLAAVRRTPEDLAALRAALRHRESAWQARDNDALVAADLLFHRAAVAAAHNRMLSDLYAHLTEGLRAIVESLLDEPEALTDEQGYQRAAHLALVDAIEAGDPDAAQRCVEHYIGDSVDSLRALEDSDR